MEDFEVWGTDLATASPSHDGASRGTGEHRRGIGMRILLHPKSPILVAWWGLILLGGFG